MGQPSCATHPETPATGSCQACLKTLCELCLLFDGSRVLCLPCARSARRTRTIFRGAVGALAVGAVAALVMTSRKKEDAAAASAAAATAALAYSSPHPELAVVEARLAKEPCDRQQMFTLDDTLSKAGDYRALIDRTEAFWKKCGPLQGARTTSVPVAVFDSLPPGVDGLLGLSFLARFNLQMETLAGKLTISARPR